MLGPALCQYWLGAFQGLPRSLNSMKSVQATAKRIPAFQSVKDYVLRQIHDGRWREGDAIPGEEALARQFGVSRMTVNRALRELSSEQVVERVQGSGTFVAQQKYRATLVELRNIADEIAARGHRHRSELHLLARSRAGDAQARHLRVAPRSIVFHSVILHFENELPIQVEDRHVNPQVVPDYLAQDFTQRTPNAYLMQVAPLQGVDFEIEASMPPANVSELLRMEAGEFCLVLRRTTYSMGQVASVAAMWHPAKRYRFTGHI